MVGSIQERQLTDEAKKLLRAYSSEYRLAKRCRTIRSVGSVFFVIAGPVTGLKSFTWAAYVAAAAGAWTVLVRVVLKRYETAYQSTGVGMQECFDTFVFQLPWDAGIAGQPPADADIVLAAKRVEGESALTRRVDAGWYSPTPGVPWPVDVLISQMSSAVWGRRQHRIYARFVAWIMGIAVVGGIAAGFALAMQLSTWLVVVFLPAMPALLDGIELAQSHWDQSGRKATLETDIHTLWERELKDPGCLTVDDCRQIQDASYAIREVPTQIPEWYYKRHRDADEMAMQTSAQTLSSRYREALAAHRD